MTDIGEREMATQRRVVRLFCDELGYENLGDLSEGDNHNIIDGQIEHFLYAYHGYDERDDGPELVRRAVAELVKVAANTSLRLHDRNKEVYQLLRYGLPVKVTVGETKKTVCFIDWDHPERNRFAVAEEVTVINPKYYEKMSELLDALIAQRRQDALDYQKYLQKIVELARQVKNGPEAGAYPKSLDSPAKRALFDNLDKDEAPGQGRGACLEGRLRRSREPARWLARQQDEDAQGLAGNSRGLGRAGRAHRQGRGAGQESE
jgi:hypothetical protein